MAAAVVVGFGLADARAAADDWKLALDEDGIAVYTRPSAASDNLAFRGTVTVPQSIDEIAVVLEDSDGYVGWYARCEWAATVKREPPDRRFVHMKIDLPFPVSDRDAVVRVDREWQGEKLVLRMTTALDVVPPQSGYVRMARVDGSWTLEPDPSGGTRVTLEQENDPSGALPAWLSNLLVTDQPMSTLTGLRETLAARSVSSR